MRTALGSLWGCDRELLQPIHGCHQNCRPVPRRQPKAFVPTAQRADGSATGPLTDHAENWAQKYSQRHRPERILEFPTGVRPPGRVRVYRHAQHYLLQWWESSRKGTTTVRVDGDLIDAMAKAREIEERLATAKHSGLAARRVRHDDLVTGFQVDLERRADAGRSPWEHSGAIAERSGITSNSHSPQRPSKPIPGPIRLIESSVWISRPTCNNDKSRPTDTS